MICPSRELRFARSESERPDITAQCVPDSVASARSAMIDSRTGFASSGLSTIGDNVPS